MVPCYSTFSTTGSRNPGTISTSIKLSLPLFPSRRLDSPSSATRRISSAELADSPAQLAISPILGKPTWSPGLQSVTRAKSASPTLNRAERHNAIGGEVLCRGFVRLTAGIPAPRPRDRRGAPFQSRWHRTPPNADPVRHGFVRLAWTAVAAVLLHVHAPFGMNPGMPVLTTTAMTFRMTVAFNFMLGSSPLSKCLSQSPKLGGRAKLFGYKVFAARFFYAAALIGFWLLRSGSYTAHPNRCSSTASFRATATTARFLPFFPPRAASVSP